MMSLWAVATRLPLALGLQKSVVLSYVCDVLHTACADCSQHRTCVEETEETRQQRRTTLFTGGAFHLIVSGVVLSDSHLIIVADQDRFVAT